MDAQHHERLSKISHGHCYRLRDSDAYREQSLTVGRTRAVSRSIGIRKKPQPNGKPGYSRADTVHQGDLDGVKGVYHEQTKSRSGKCNDNALIESNNGSVVRKHMGHWHIPKYGARKINTFSRTPCQKLLSIPKVETYLKKEVTVETLTEKMTRMSHIEYADSMHETKQKLFAAIKKCYTHFRLIL